MAAWREEITAYEGAKEACLEKTNTKPEKTKVGLKKWRSRCMSLMKG
jgi:hypothetical protein